MAGLVLQAAAEDLPVDVGAGEELAAPEHGEDEAFADEVEEVGARRVRRAGHECLRRPLEHRVDVQEAAAPGEGPLAEDLEVAGLVHDLGGEERLDLQELRRDPVHPLGREVAGQELDLGEEGGQLAGGLLEVLGEFFEFVPGDVLGGVPLPGLRLLVEGGDVVGPQVPLLGHDEVVVDGEDVLVRIADRAPGSEVAMVVGDRLGDRAVRLRPVDVHEGEAPGRRLDLGAPGAAVRVHPLQPERALLEAFDGGSRELDPRLAVCFEGRLVGGDELVFPFVGGERGRVEPGDGVGEVSHGLRPPAGRSGLPAPAFRGSGGRVPWPAERASGSWGRAPWPASRPWPGRARC